MARIKFLSEFLRTTVKFTKDICFFVLGILTLPIIILFIIAAVPAILFRTLINKVLLPCFLRRKYGFTRLVSTGFGTAYATELVSSLVHNRPSRNVQLQCSLIQDHIPYDECIQRIQDGLVNAKKINVETGKEERKLPELSEYIVSWMGYLFWKKDSDFSIHNHLHYHQLDITTDLDEFCKDLFEKLLNKKYAKNRSAWEAHVVHGVKNSHQMTALILSIHHALGDGLSIIAVGLEGYFGVQLKDCYKTQTKSIVISPEPLQPNCLKSFGYRVKTCIANGFDLIYDLGCLATFIAWRANRNTPLYIPDEKKSWEQIYERSQRISIDKIRHIRKYFGVTFSAVSMSSIASAVAKLIESKSSEKTDVKNFLCAAPMLLPDHPIDKLNNHITGTAYKIPVDADLESVDRVRKCDAALTRVNRSMINRIFPFLSNLLSYHVTPIAKFGFKNYFFGASTTNSVGPFIEIVLENGSRLVEIFGAVGCYDGVAGVVILVFSYGNSFRFNVMAERAVMSKTELKQFVANMETEIDILYNKSFQDVENTSSIVNCNFKPL